MMGMAFDILLEMLHPWANLLAGTLLVVKATTLVGVAKNWVSGKHLVGLGARLAFDNTTALLWREENVWTWWRGTYLVPY